MSVLRGHSSSISCLRYSEQLLASGSLDATVKLWDLNKSGECIHTLKGHNDIVRCVDFHRSSGILFTGSDSIVKVFSLQNGKLLNTLKLHSQHVTCMQFDPETKLLYTGGEDQQVKIVDTRSMQSVNAKSISFPGGVTCLRVYQGQLLAGCKNQIKLWQLEKGEMLDTFSYHTDSVRCADLDSEYVISGSDDMTLHVQCRKTGEHFPLLGHTGKVRCLQFDQNKLVSGSTDSNIMIWSLSEKKCVHTLHLPDQTCGWVRCLQFDSTRLFSGHGDNVIRIWNFLPKYLR